MPNVRVCTLFRPLNLKERSDHGDSVSIRGIDAETFVLKDEKEEEIEFRFDRVFFQGSEQSEIYQFLALPIVEAVITGLNGAIITFGQTGAGKTYSMQGPSIIECHVKHKGLLPRVVDGLFCAIKLSDDTMKYAVKLSMVEIDMERVRDLFDLSKDNLQIKENKVQGIFVNGAIEISISDSAEALQSLSTGIANRAVGETQINMASSRSHCIYIFMIQQESKKGKRSGKLILLDLAGSRKQRELEQKAKPLKKPKPSTNHCQHLEGGPTYHIRIPNSHESCRMLLGGTPRLLYCVAAPLSTLRFGARAKHIKALPYTTLKEVSGSLGAAALTKNESAERILRKLGERMTQEDVQLFILEGIFFDPYSVEEVESAYEDVTSTTISSLRKAVEELMTTVDELKKENQRLKGLVKSC